MLRGVALRVSIGSRRMSTPSSCSKVEGVQERRQLVPLRRRMWKAATPADAIPQRVPRLVRLYFRVGGTVAFGGCGSATTTRMRGDMTGGLCGT
jgi:hypothetical protein